VVVDQRPGHTGDVGKQGAKGGHVAKVRERRLEADDAIRSIPHELRSPIRGHRRLGYDVERPCVSGELGHVGSSAGSG
jgi:hypothetical protein